MGPKKRKIANHDEISNTTSNSSEDTSDAQSLTDLLTVLGKSAEEIELLKKTAEIRMMMRYDVDDCIVKLCLEFEIRVTIGKYLQLLYNFEIVAVCDDSGSMNSLVDGTQFTRWNELCKIVKTITKIATLFDSNGIDIYFLNRDPILNVKDAAVIDQKFQIPPRGYTPLVPVLNKIFDSKYARPNEGKKLLVLIATDGEPTDADGNPNINELKHVMEKRLVDTTYVSFLLCTDDLESIAYLKDWDKTMKHVDVVDDYRTEIQNIRRCQNRNDYPFPFGDYIVKILLGSVVPELDRLNDEY